MSDTLTLLAGGLSRVSPAPAGESAGLSSSDWEEQSAPGAPPRDTGVNGFTLAASLPPPSGEVRRVVQGRGRAATLVKRRRDLSRAEWGVAAWWGESSRLRRLMVGTLQAGEAGEVRKSRGATGEEVGRKGEVWWEGEWRREEWVRVGEEQRSVGSSAVR